MSNRKDTLPNTILIREGESLPKQLDPDMIYVCHKQTDSKPYLANFICPCGCGRECPIGVVPMDEKTNDLNNSLRNQAWGVAVNPQTNTTTIHPSIRWLSGCKAHFTITDGVVQWHSDSGL